MPREHLILAALVILSGLWLGWVCLMNPDGESEINWEEDQ